eukprot:9471345-Pyramimonas_sp.AAC.1
MALRLDPVLARAVLGNSFNIRRLMATNYHTLIIDEDSCLAQAGFTAGKAHAIEAQRLRDQHMDNPTEHEAPELIMGPAC